jgi:hypothetical protein
MTDELHYHLDELRADLSTAQKALEVAKASVRPDRQLVRAWLDVQSILEHDLDTHLPAIVELLGYSRFSEASPNRIARHDSDLIAAAARVEPLVREAQRTLATSVPSRGEIEASNKALRSALAIASAAHASSVKAAALGS